MELLDRYLLAIRKHLPWQRQDDIVAELRANLEAQVQEKEAELGRPLTGNEAEAWIKGLDAPIRVAAGYRTQQYLIGPPLFPFYLYAMKLALTWTGVVYAIVTAVLFMVKAPGAEDLLAAILRAPGVLLTSAAWVTLIVAAVEYAALRGYIKLPAQACGAAVWSVKDLPQTDGSAKPPSYAKAVAEAIFSFLWLIYLLLIPGHPFLLLGPGAWYLNSLPQHLAPVWVQFYWAVVALNIVQIGWRLESLWSGRWQRDQRIRQIAFQAVGLIPIGILLAAPGQNLVVLRDRATASAADIATRAVVNHYTYLGFEIIFAIAACKLLWDLAVLWRDHARSHSAAIR